MNDHTILIKCGKNNSGHGFYKFILFFPEEPAIGFSRSVSSRFSSE